MSNIEQIIDNIWKENKHLFRSRQEVHVYVYKYLQILSRAIARFSSIDVPGIGRLALTQKGMRKKSNRRAKSIRSHNRTSKNTRKELSKGNIDDYFPE